MVVQACRVCLSTKPPLHSFSENNVKISFEDLIGSQIDLNINLPHHVCNCCKDNILQFVEFKKCCLQIQDLLETKFAERIQITKKILEEIRVTVEPQNIVINQSVLSKADNKAILSCTTEYFRDDNENQHYEDDLDQKDCISVEDDMNEDFIKPDPKNIEIGPTKIVAQAYEGFLQKVKSEESISDTFNRNDDTVVVADGSNKEMSQKTDNNDKLPECKIPEISLDDNQTAIKGDDIKYVNKTKSHDEFKPVLNFKRKYKLHSTTITKICKTNELQDEDLIGKRLLLKDEQSEVKDENIKVQKWQCSSCKYVFLCEEAMQQHLQNCNALYSPCGLCGANFRNLKRLYEHMAREHKGTSDTTLTCLECNVEFKEQSTLDKHVHRGKVKKKPKPKVERPLTKTTHLCYECGKQFKLPCLLRQHMMKHTGEKPFACDVCHQRFRLEMTLRTHKFMHSGEKPFKCSSCSQTFRQSSHLRRHMRTHTGERPYTCSLCDKKFSQNWNRDEHVRTVHEGLPPKPRPGKLKKRLQTNTV